MTDLIDTRTHCFKTLPFRASPHFNDRPEGIEPYLIVVHGISLPAGEFGTPYVDQLFMGELDTQQPELASLEGVRVSAHLFINRCGKVVQYVPFHKRAWHAGVSEYQGRSGCNDFSIGIELEGTDRLDYEPAQYNALNGVIRALLDAYPSLDAERIVGHSDVAPGRKTDPGPSFDWDRLAF